MQKLALTTVLILSMSAVFANSKGDKILHDIDSLAAPKFDQSKAKDPNYMKQIQKEYADYYDQKGALILELYKEDPTNPKTAELMKSRWMMMGSSGGDGDELKAKVDSDIDKILSENPPEAIREAGDYCKVSWDLRGLRGDDPSKEAGAMKELQDFATKYPHADDTPDLLFMAGFSLKDQDKTTIYRQILSEFPNYKNDSMIQGALNQADAIGKPFALSFTDAVSRKAIDVANMKGKVVLVDFWATWCGPCRAEMPTVKDYYQKYHDKGVEIVGVSLDQPESKGGLTKLKDYVAQNQIPWPMYYQGNYWDSKFSSSWGIMSIPTMFIVDKQGNFQGTIEPRNSADFEAKLNKYLNQ